MKIYNLDGKVLMEIPGDTLIKADLKDKHLVRADFRNQNMTEADLERAFCMGADFSGNTTLHKAYMPYIRAEGAIFNGTDFEEANMERGIFRNANFLGAKNWNKIKRDLYADFTGATMPDGQKVEKE